MNHSFWFAVCTIEKRKRKLTIFLQIPYFLTQFPIPFPNQNCWKKKWGIEWGKTVFVIPWYIGVNQDFSIQYAYGHITLMFASFFKTWSDPRDNGS